MRVRLVAACVLGAVMGALPALAACPGLPLDFTGTQAADCLEPLLRGAEIAPGLDLMGQSVAVAPPKCDGSSLPAHPGLTFTGFSANSATSIWATRYTPDGVTTTYTLPRTWSVDIADGQINGVQCGGVLANIGNGLAFFASTCEGKGTDSKSLCVVDLATGQCKTGTGFPNATQYMGDALKTYGGTNPYANCGYYYHNPPDGSCHMYCLWFGVTVTVAYHVTPGWVTVTVLSYSRGPATPLNDPARNDPASALTYVGTPLVWSGALPPGMVETGELGVGAKAIQSNQSLTLTALREGL